MTTDERKDPDRARAESPEYPCCHDHLCQRTDGGILPYGASAFNAQFLPSPDYLLVAWPAAVACALLSALTTIWVFWSGSRAMENNGWGIWLGSVALMGLIGMNSIMIGVPMVRAWIVPQTVILQFKVGKGLALRCKDPVTFQGLPLFFNSLCRAPAGLREVAKPGVTIGLRGKGSAWGIFPHPLR